MSHTWDCPDRFESERRGRDDAHSQWWRSSPERNRFGCDEADRYYQDAWEQERKRMEDERREERLAEEAREEARYQAQLAEQAAYEQAVYEAQMQAAYDQQMQEAYERRAEADDEAEQRGYRQ